MRSVNTSVKALSDSELQKAIDACAEERIHTPGSIQPHGFLIALSENLIIQKVSQNCERLFQKSIDEIINTSLTTYIEADTIQELREKTTAGDLNPLRATLLHLYGQGYVGIMHHSKGTLILELEPHEGTRTSQQGHFGEDFYQELMQFSVQLQRISNQELLHEHVVNVVKRVTGFARVKLYKFDTSWNGQVVAEAREPHMPTYLGLHFPHSDIPRQARVLYAKNYLRLIPDASYTPCPLVPDDLANTGEPVDLSFSVLRSVSPVHIQYLLNMDVAASMSISILQNDKLWGLIACHHDKPHHVSYRVRMLAELLGHSFSAFLSSMNQAAKSNQHAARIAMLNELSASLNPNSSLLHTLKRKYELLLKAVDADGVILSLDGKHYAFGLIPEIAFTQDLIDWLQKNYEDRVFASDSIHRDTGLIPHGQSMASGVLAIPVSRRMTNYIIWFRQEQRARVAWAGKPQKSVKRRGDKYHLTPRRSFEAWQQSVRGMAKAWDADDIKTGEAVAKMILTKKYEDSLRQKNIDLATILDHSSAFVILTDTKGKVMMMNTVALDAFGLTEEQVEGRGFEDFLDPATALQFQQQREQVAFEQASITVEQDFSVGSQTFHLITAVFPLFDINDDVYAICSISNDISRLRQTEQELLKSNKELERMAFLGAHDLKEPLRLVTSFGHLLATQYQDRLDQQGLDYIGYMQEATKRMKTLIDDLLDYSRLANDDFESHLIDTQKEYETVVESLLKLEGEEATVFHCSEQLPAIHMKQGHFACVMQNLLGNALKYRSQERHPHIVTTHHLQEGQHVFSVSDNGIGIKQEYWSKIFIVFKRLHTRSEYEGNGVGLALCQRIVESYGGSIWVESSYDVGSTFSFSIPAT